MNTIQHYSSKSRSLHWEPWRTSLIIFPPSLSSSSQTEHRRPVYALAGLSCSDNIQPDISDFFSDYLISYRYWLYYIRIWYPHKVSILLSVFESESGQKYENKALFRFQVFSLSPSHQIFGHMHGVLNVDKKITNYSLHIGNKSRLGHDCAYQGVIN